MEHTQEDWDKMENELNLLKEQNHMLKRIIEELKRQYEQGQTGLIRSTMQPHVKKAISRQDQPYICIHCQPRVKSKQQLVSEFNDWSQKLKVTLFYKDPELKMTHSRSNQFNIDSPVKKEESKQSKEEEPSEDVGLIEKICLFGPNQKKVVTMEDKRVNVPHQLFFPKKDPLYSLLQSYGHSLYPEQVEVKVIRERNKNTQIDRIIFRKNLKPSDFKLVIFQSKEEFSLPTNKIRRQWNPFSTIYCVSVDFPDYIHSDSPYMGIVNRAISMIEENMKNEKIEKQQETEGDRSPQKIKLEVPNMLRHNSSVSVYGETTVYKSNFNLSLMSYYPLIDFFCNFLKQIINFIKIKRMEEHAKHPGELEQLMDIKSVVNNMESAFDKFQPFYTAEVDVGKEIDLELGQAKFQMKLDQTKVREELSRDWAYRMLRLLDRETLYDIYCLVMQEESVVFFCENSYILTFMIYLFVGLLIHPFSYPHTIISSVFDLDHLQTPFIAIMGLNRPNSWLQENQEELLEKMSGKVLVHLTEDKIKIKGRKKAKAQKSEKLSKIFKSFYSRVDKLKSGSNERKQILTREVSKQQNDLVLQLVSQIQNFYQEELLRYKPNVEIINAIKRQLIKDNENLASVSARLVKTVEEYITQSRKNLQKDPFADSLMQKQIFSVYLTICYDIV